MYTIMKSHVNKFGLIYVTEFDTEVQARHFIDWRNSRPITSDCEDSFYTYYIFHGKCITESKPRGKSVKKVETVEVK